MAGRNEKEKDNVQYISQEQVRELMDQQKAFYKELLQQQESSFKVCMCTFMDSTNTRMDAILKELQELKVCLQFTQKEVDDLKASSVSLSSNCKDIHKLAESMIVIDAKASFLMLRPGAKCDYWWYSWVGEWKVVRIIGELTF